MHIYFSNTKRNTKMYYCYLVCYMLSTCANDCYQETLIAIICVLLLSATASSLGPSPNNGGNKFRSPPGAGSPQKKSYMCVALY